MLAARVVDNRLKTDNEMEVTFEGVVHPTGCDTPIELVILHHIRYNCFEILLYNPSLEMEAPRIFLSASKLLALYPKEECDKEVNEKVEFYRKRHRHCEAAVIRKLANSNFVKEYIEQRLAVRFHDYGSDGTKHIFVGQLQLRPSDEFAGGSNCKGSAYVPGQMPNGMRLAVVIPKPDLLVPANTVAGQEENTHCLHQYFERMRQIQLIGVEAFWGSIQRRAKRRAVSQNSSPIQARWQSTINRVIRRNFVQRMRARLESLCFSTKTPEKIIARERYRQQMEQEIHELSERVAQGSIVAKSKTVSVTDGIKQVKASLVSHLQAACSPLSILCPKPHSMLPSLGHAIGATSVPSTTPLSARNSLSSTTACKSPSTTLTLAKQNTHKPPALAPAMSSRALAAMQESKVKISHRLASKGQSRPSSPHLSPLTKTTTVSSPVSSPMTPHSFSKDRVSRGLSNPAF